MQAASAARDLASCAVPAGPCGAAALAGARMTVTGDGCASRRAHLGISEASTVVLLSTESSSANPILSRSKIGLAGDLQVFCVSGGVRVLVDQAAQDGFSADLLCVDAGRRGAGSVRFVVGDALRYALVRPGCVVATRCRSAP